MNRSSGFTGYNPYLSFGRSLYALLPEGDQVSVEQAAFLSGLKTQSTTSAGDSEGGQKQNHLRVSPLPEFNRGPEATGEIPNSPAEPAGNLWSLV